MLFGSKQTFAIEAYTEPDLKLPSAVWGRMCLWSEGMMIGNLDEPYCALYITAVTLRERVELLNTLWRDEFNNMTDEEIFSRFDHACYIGDVESKSLEEICRQSEPFWKFNFLTNWGEQFDPLKGFLGYHPSGDVLIIIRQAHGELIARRIDPDLFLWVARSFADWFDQEEERLNM